MWVSVLGSVCMWEGVFLCACLLVCAFACVYVFGHTLEGAEGPGADLNIGFSCLLHQRLLFFRERAPSDHSIGLLLPPLL